MRPFCCCKHAELVLQSWQLSEQKCGSQGDSCNFSAKLNHGISSGEDKDKDGEGTKCTERVVVTSSRQRSRSSTPSSSSASSNSRQPRRSRSLSPSVNSHANVTDEVPAHSLNKSSGLDSNGFDLSPTIGQACLELLTAIVKFPGRLFVNKSSRKSYYMIRRRRTLTKQEENDAKRRAKQHWICVSLGPIAFDLNSFTDTIQHVCKLTDGEIILNHGSKACKRVTECHHDHRGCEDCPSLGNHMYEELMEYFRDEIRKEYPGRRRR